MAGFLRLGRAEFPASGRPFADESYDFDMIQRSKLGGTDFDFYPLEQLARSGSGDPSGLPMTVKVLLEGLLRLVDRGITEESNVASLAAWPVPASGDSELPFLPARVLMQDFTGVPAVVDLAAMRSAMKRAGKDAGKVDPLVPVDLIIDHSVQVDSFGFRDSYTRNIEKEIERNRERYALLRWAQQAFHNFSAAPLGAAGLPQLLARPARHGHLPPGQPRAPGQGRPGARCERPQSRDP